LLNTRVTLGIASYLRRERVQILSETLGNHCRIPFAFSSRKRLCGGFWLAEAVRRSWTTSGIPAILNLLNPKVARCERCPCCTC